MAYLIAGIVALVAVPAAAVLIFIMSFGSIVNTIAKGEVNDEET